MAIAFLRATDIVQQSGGLQDGSFLPGVFFFGPLARQAIVKLQSEPGHVIGVLHVRIEERAP